MIDIRDVSGSLIVSVPVTEACEHVSELMVSDYVVVSYSSTTGTTLPAGAYLIFNGVTYRLLAPYKPQRISEVEYNYEPQFQSKVMAWSVRPFFFLQKVEGVVIGRETDWTLTDTLPNFLAAIVDSLLDELGETYTYSYDAGLTGTKSLSFEATSIFDALNEIASAWETEWYLNGTVITFGKCAHGTAVTLTVGTDVSVPDVTPANEGYYTRFYAFGSSRNIDQDYDSGSTTNHVVQKRLALPAATCPLGYKDIQANLPATQIFTKVLIFDDIYPSSNLAISAVRAVLKYAYDGDGNKIQIGVDEFSQPIYEQYSIFFFKIAGFTFTESMIVSGKTLSVHFESGNLLGREFELGYNSTSAEYEIIFDESTGYIIPNEVLIPADGDTVILFNILMPQAYVDAAEAELEDAVDAEIAGQVTDLNTYRVNSLPVRFTQLGITLTVGSNVTFINGANTLSTRVLSITEKLDFPVQKTIQIGEKKTYRTTQQLKEAVTNINKNVDVIAALNDLSVTIQNAYGRTQKQIAAALAQWNNMWYFDKSADETPDQTDYERWIVRSNFDLFIDGQIQASNEITAWIAGAVQNEVLANLTATAPLRKDASSNVRMDYDTNQFELVSGALTIKTGILTPSEHDHAIADVTGLQIALDNKLAASLKGAVSGLAELDATGKVPNSQLPSAASSLELGETLDTAYRGDRGKTAYDHSQLTGSNPHQTTFTQLVGLPTTLAGYGITDALSSTDAASFAAATHNHATLLADHIGEYTSSHGVHIDNKMFVDAGYLSVNTSLSAQRVHVYAGNIRFDSVSEPVACTAALAGSGAGLVTNGVHRYVVVFVCASGETGQNSNYAEVTVTNNTVDGRVLLSNIPTAPLEAGCTARRIYRSAAGQQYYSAQLLATINDNTTTSFLDNLADASLGITIYRKENTTSSIFYKGTNKFAQAGAYNTTFGGSAGTSMTTGYCNTFMGSAVAQLLNTGYSNTAIGYVAMGSATTAYNNVAVGYAALTGILGGQRNTALGYYAGGAITNGQYNIAIGAEAGGVVTTGSGNIHIGRSVNASAAAVTNEFRLGYQTTYLLEGSMLSGSAWVGTGYPFKTNTINEFTADAGVTIDGLLIKDGSIKTANFSILEENSKLVIKYGATVIASISSTGAIIAGNEVSAFGTP